IKDQRFSALRTACKVAAGVNRAASYLVCIAVKEVSSAPSLQVPGPAPSGAGGSRGSRTSLTAPPLRDNNQSLFASGPRSVLSAIANCG
uniref:Uncharacterized protein n=1 Tax=Melopsittacus undulatus TaxID=13146 RepID=A0A8C6JA57_MELUD